MMKKKKKMKMKKVIISASVLLSLVIISFTVYMAHKINNAPGLKEYPINIKKLEAAGDVYKNRFGEFALYTYGEERTKNDIYVIGFRGKEQEVYVYTIKAPMSIYAMQMGDTASVTSLMKDDLQKDTIIFNIIIFDENAPVEDLRTGIRNIYDNIIKEWPGQQVRGGVTTYKKFLEITSAKKKKK